jgi:hypothetical protein
VTWVRLDDQFHTNRKAVIAGIEGRALYVAGLCWCALNSTDGEVDKRALPTVAALAGVQPSIADTLVAVGLWEARNGFYLVPDYLDYNPSREQVIAEREAAAERQRRVRASRRASRRDTGGSNAVSSPAPVPIPTTENTPSSSHNSRLHSQPVDEDVLAAVPGEVWVHFADIMLAKQPAGSVKQAVAWKRRTRENANLEHGDTAARWWRDYELTPRCLAECLVDGQAPRNEYRRKATA